MTAQTSPIHVAIVGGGITGLVLAIGLRARGISHTLYERAAGFSEYGAGIGFSPNAEVAMTLIDPQLHAVFKQAVTPNGLDYFQWIDGFTTDDQIFQLYLGRDGFQGGRRSEILGAWAALVEPANVQFGKEVVAVIDPKNGPVNLSFADGTTATADVVIGADGVWSRVRTLLFGPEFRASYTHQYCFRAVVPMDGPDGAVAALGQARASSRYMYNGPGAHAITYPVAKGALLNVLVVIGDDKPWGDATRASGSNDEQNVSADTGVANRQTTGKGRRADAEAVLAGWQSTPRAVVGLLPDTPDRWAIFDMLEHPVPTYNRGRVALAGDAAHAAGPHLGSGAGFGIEDALALSTVLAEVNNPAMVDSALSAYSKVRYERTQWLVRATREAVDLFQWAGPGAQPGADPNHGQDPAVFGPEITWRFHTIWKYDLERMQAEVRALYEAALGAR
ncbi:salicylate hydroxylase [Sporothrix brasiliensis 5110]|uniref:Salicylate hydroxylase n=1 Tax=Sporothrix brasiliensis 5110 TaxID=1398154 RepID=A0A0C2IZB5_9PEZI|nr:salicylate hydroxylase [Sporothrix brasiliensis 5110]KIH92065.1 salicylate hydroxylase [Sporothrix brasiliensis 5110]